MKKLISILLVAAVLLSMLCMTASAETELLAGDVNGDGKVTPFDALQVQAYLHGEITLTDAQIAAAIAACPAIEQLSTAHIVAIYFKPLVGQSSEAPEEDGMYHIRTPLDFAKLRAFPYAAFSLDNDIDMAQASWTPSIFYGYLLGNGHTISNLTITAAKNNVNAGALFVKLGSANFPNATVSNLKLESPTLTTASTHKYAGLVCGSNYGVISDVTISNGALAGEMNSATNFAGAITGMNYGAVSCPDALSCEMQYVPSGDLIVGSTQPNAVTQTGNARITSQGTLLLDREQFTETVDDPAALRQIALNEMDEMANIKWYSKKKVTYRDNLSLSAFEVKAYTTYYGMKYGHQGASLEAMKDQCSLSGSTYITNGNFTSYNTENTSGTYYIPEYDLIMGNYFSNDCSTAVYWAWMKVSDSFTGERARRFVPTPENCANFGIVMVGNYDLSDAVANGGHTFWYSNAADGTDPQYRSIFTNDDGSINPDKLNALYESYAQLQIGDSITQRNKFYKEQDGKLVQSSDGHTKMVRGLNVVRDANGNIDPEQSTISTIECGGGGTKLHTPSSWNFNNYSFRAYAGLQTDGSFSLTEKSAVYVPATIKELATGHRDAAYIQLKNSTSALDGIVSSNYRIVWTSVTIDGVTDKSYTGMFGRRTGLDGVDIPYEGLDESGSTSAATVKAFTNTNWEAARLTYKSVNLEKHAAAFSTLKAGEHTYTITVKISTGESKTFTGTFTT